MIRGAVVATAGLVMVGSSSPARADDKKSKAGLFDFDFSHWKTPAGRQREAAKQLAPGNLDLSPAFAHGAPRAVRVRVYADRDYRQTIMRWQARFKAQLERTNRVVEPVFGVTFEIESVREWKQSHVGLPLEPVLAELEALDPGKEVDWVVGLVTPFRGVATSIHQVAGARLMARHFVLRGMDDEQEGEALERELPLLSPAERDDIYADRRAHKEIVIFLHEWAHTMGALHNGDRAIIMNPAYDPNQARFSEFEMSLIGLVVDRRLTHRSELFPESQELERLLASAPPDEGSDKDRASLSAAARERARGGGDPGPTTAGSSGVEAQAFNRALETLNEAAGYVNAGDNAKAAPLVLAGAARVTAAPPDVKLAMFFARLAGAVGALTAGEAVLARVGHGGDPELATKLVRLAGELDAARHRLALPRDAARWGIPPEKEPAFSIAFWSGVTALASGGAAGARARLKELSDVYPDAPGTDVLACEVELRARHAAAATKRCEAALAKFDEATRAHYLLGFIAAQTRRDAVAEKHFRRAILLDPTDRGAWQELARLYRATRAVQRLQELRAQHQALLSSPLPE